MSVERFLFVSRAVLRYWYIRVLAAECTSLHHFGGGIACSCLYWAERQAVVVACQALSCLVLPWLQRKSTACDGITKGGRRLRRRKVGSGAWSALYALLIAYPGLLSLCRAFLGTSWPLCVSVLISAFAPNKHYHTFHCCMACRNGAERPVRPGGGFCFPRWDYHGMMRHFLPPLYSSLPGCVDRPFAPRSSLLNSITT